MKLSSILELLGSELCEKSNFESQASKSYTGISFDSRTVKSGEIYFSVPGVNQDGTTFISDAIKAGASLIIAPQTYSSNLSQDALVLRVRDVRKALALVANSFFGDPSARLRMIGVSGTNGKTSVCWILSKVLSYISGPTIYLGTLGTVIMRAGQEERLSPEVQTTRDPLFNNQMLSKALESGCINAVMEVTSHGLTQYRTYGIEWDVCAFTNLTQDHLDYHKDMKEYGEAKKKLYLEELQASPKPKKSAVINSDDSLGQALIEELSPKATQLLSFSKVKKNSDLYLENVKLNTYTSTLFLNYGGNRFEVTSPLLGSFNYENLLCALGTLLEMGYSPEMISKCGEYIESVPGRIELISESLPRVFVDYAHTPDALDKIQDVLKEMLKEGERLITVFGCGGDRDSKKRPLMGASVLTRSDIGIVTSDNPRTENPQKIIDDILKGILGSLDKYPNFKLIEEIDRKEAIRTAIEQANQCDIILIAGKGHEDYQILGNEKIFFCDRTYGKEFLDNRGQ